MVLPMSLLRTAQNQPMCLGLLTTFWAIGGAGSATHKMLFQGWLLKLQLLRETYIRKPSLDGRRMELQLLWIMEIANLPHYIPKDGGVEEWWDLQWCVGLLRWLHELATWVFSYRANGMCRFLLYWHVDTYVTCIAWDIYKYHQGLMQSWYDVSWS